MGITARHLSKMAAVFYGVLIVTAAAQADASVILADSPLFLTVTMPPNITLTLDDSGSMARAWVPEENCDGSANDINGCREQENRYEKSYVRNLLYYNPNVKYPAAKKADGSSMTTSFTNAWTDGFDTSKGAVDLSKDYRPTATLHARSDDLEEWYMPHNGDDVQCRGSRTPRCQIRDASGTWDTPDTATSCSDDTDCTGAWSTQRNNNSRVVGRSVVSALPAKMPAYYYVYNKSATGCASGTAYTNNDCYKMVIVSDSSGTVDFNADGAVDASEKDERQNFANWYSFARTRNLATMTAATLAFSDLSPDARVAWQALNSCDSLPTTSCKGWKKSDSAVSNAIGPFVDTATKPHKSDFWKWLTRVPTNSGTGLPEAMQRVGKYYQKSGENSPYDNNFSTNNSGEYECRRNYHIMMTDGIWNAAVTSDVQDGNPTVFLPDTATEPDPDIDRYQARAPYKDSNSNTLADMAFQYWITDLRPDLKNNLLPIYVDRTAPANTDAPTTWFWNPRNDPATWQHMVNFTIGLGLSGYLSQTSPALTYNGTYGGSFPSLANGTLNWPKADKSGGPGNVADLWHAAINSRGQFFSADDPNALSTAFKTVITAISGDAGSAASLAANSTGIQPGSTIIYQARFAKDWSGGLIAYPIDSHGIGQPYWDASEHIPAASLRKIFTYDGTKGVPFDACTSLSAAQKLVLNKNPNTGLTDSKCTDRLNWLRGDSTNEQRNGGIFRNRPTTVMGDIINSDPGYVKNLDYKFGDLPAGTPGQSTYLAYVNGNANRIPMIYVGSNDGRLYGIRADHGQPAVTATGEVESGGEQFSYIPNGVFPQINRLMDPAYVHRYYADGPVTVGDAYFGAAWHSVVVAGLNSGGKSVYALDVTDPLKFNEAKVLWEFNDAGSTEMGMTFSQPQIGILENGTWVAVFGNGYNSVGGGAYLYVLNLETGVLIRKLKASDVANSDENNGLSTPLLADTDGNKLMDTVYAGDLLGNMWKFDLSGSSGSWNVAFSGKPLFTAQNANKDVQHITAQPKVTGLAIGGRIVVFGTGRYLATTDVANKEIQSLYGIRDDGTTPVTTLDRSELQQQTIDHVLASPGGTARVLSHNDVDWTKKKGWYLDLVEPSTAADGERVVSATVIKKNRAIFTTIDPSSDPCVPGGVSWLMEVDFSTGGGFNGAILDLNGDGKIDANDRLSIDGNPANPSALRLDGLGISKTSLVLDSALVSNPDDGGGGGGDGGGGDGGAGGAVEFNKFNTGQTGRITDTGNGEEAPDEPPPESGTVHRRSWIQIR
jgi:type IV pilus assembly protein PilY1